KTCSLSPHTAISQGLGPRTDRRFVARAERGPQRRRHRRIPGRCRARRWHRQRDRRRLGRRYELAAVRGWGRRRRTIGISLRRPTLALVVGMVAMTGPAKRRLLAGRT